MPGFITLPTCLRFGNCTNFPAVNTTLPAPSMPAPVVNMTPFWNSSYPLAGHGPVVNLTGGRNATYVPNYWNVTGLTHPSPREPVPVNVTTITVNMTRPAVNASRPAPGALAPPFTFPNFWNASHQPPYLAPPSNSSVTPDIFVNGSHPSTTINVSYTRPTPASTPPLGGVFNTSFYTFSTSTSTLPPTSTSSPTFTPTPCKQGYSWVTCEDSNLLESLGTSVATSSPANGGPLGSTNDRNVGAAYGMAAGIFLGIVFFAMAAYGFGSWWRKRRKARKEKDGVDLEDGFEMTEVRGGGFTSPVTPFSAYPYAQAAAAAAPEHTGARRGSVVSWATRKFKGLTVNTQV